MELFFDLIKAIINSLYLYIFIYLFILYIILNIINKFPYIKENNYNKIFLLDLDNFMIKNKIYSFFMFIVYIFFFVVLFFILRFNMLGKTILVIKIHAITLNNIVSIFFAILCIIYYIKILNLIFYPYIIRIHFYLLSFSFYSDKTYSWIVSKDAIISSFFRDLSMFGIYLSTKRNDVIERYKSQLKYAGEVSYTYWKSVFLFRRLIRNYKSIKYFFYVYQIIVDFLENYSSRFLYYLPHSCVVIILFYDINHYQLYYIYYMLMVLFFTNIIKKIRKFYEEKDLLYDNIISCYLYDAILHEELKKKKEINDKREEIDKRLSFDFMEIYLLGKNLKQVLYHEEAIKHYILNDFKVYYVLDPVRANDAKYLRNADKRIHVIFLLFLLIIYLMYKNYTIILFNTFIINIIVFPIILMLISYYIHTKILVSVKDTEQVFNLAWSENNYYKKIFVLLLIITIIPILYIILKNKLTINPNEIIFEIKDFIIIKEFFSMQDKQQYLEFYLKYLKISLNFEEKIWSFFEKQLVLNLDLQDDVSLEQLRNKIKDISEI